MEACEKEKWAVQEYLFNIRRELAQTSIIQILFPRWKFVREENKFSRKLRRE